MAMTQSYLNKATTDFLTTEGWKLLYEDLPGGSRSGVGLTGKLNAVWEGLYNLSPDLLYIKDGQLLLGEVDTVLNQEYLNKFEKYQSRAEELVSAISIALGKDISKVSYIFVAKNNNKEIPPLRITHLDYEAGKFSQTELLFPKEKNLL